MEKSEKILVEQAWSLQLKLHRQRELNSHPFRVRREINCTSKTRKLNINDVHERAYLRYLRRLKKLWI